MVGAILAERCTRALYASLLRNLVPAYRALEAGLDRHAELARDLERLVGNDWESRLPLLGEGARYAERVEAAAEGSGALLIAHAYTRYLGDLGGGPLLKRHLGRALGLDSSCLSFYDFPEVGDLRAFARWYRVALDDAGSYLGEEDLIVEEGVAAFRLNIDLSEAVVAAAPRPVDVIAG